MKYVEDNSTNPKHLFWVFILFPIISFLIMSGFAFFGVNSSLKKASISNLENHSVTLSKVLSANNNIDILALLDSGTSQKSSFTSPDKTQLIDTPIYSIQAGSFSQKSGAIKQYNSLLSALPSTPDEYSLRVEKIGKYYSVRVGTFLEKSVAAEVQKKLPAVLGKTVLTQARINKDRIIMSNMKRLEKTKTDTTYDYSSTEAYKNTNNYLKSIVATTNITDIGLFTLAGELVYNTDILFINDYEPNNSAVNTALSGTINSSFFLEEAPTNIAGKRNTSPKIIRTYVPIRSTTEEIIGAYKIDIDVSQYQLNIKDRLVKFVQLVFVSIVSILVLFLLFMRPKIQKLSKMKEQLLEFSATDSLTGLFDRATAFTHLESEFSRLHNDIGRKEDIKSIGCILAEIDNLKKFNDNYGYHTGDKVLQFVSNLILDTLRPYDVAGRCGGGEFIIILPNTSLKDTQKAAERICTNIRTAQFESIEGKHSFTLSVGISCLTDYDTSIDFAVKRAETSLDKAKKSGHDRVCWDEALEI